MTDQENPPVIATIVADADRLDFFPTFFGKYFMACGFHGHPATYSMNIRPLIPR